MYLVYIPVHINVGNTQNKNAGKALIKDNLNVTLERCRLKLDK